MIYYTNEIWSLLSNEYSSTDINNLGISLYEKGYIIEAEVCWQRAFLLDFWNSDIAYNIQNNTSIFTSLPLPLLCISMSLLLSGCILKIKERWLCVSTIAIVFLIFLCGLFHLSYISHKARIHQDSTIHTKILGMGESVQVRRGDYVQVIQRHGDEYQIELVNHQRYWISTSLLYTFQADNEIEKLQTLAEYKDEHSEK